MSRADALDPILCPSGVYLIDAKQRDRVVSGHAFPPGFRVAVLGGKAVSGRETFFTEVAHALGFPDYFGRNWDAVHDCLTDLSWLPADGVVLLLDGVEHLARNEPEQWNLALKVLRDACAFWEPLTRKLFVLLYVPGNHAFGLKALPAPCLHASPDGERYD